MIVGVDHVFSELIRHNRDSRHDRKLRVPGRMILCGEKWHTVAHFGGLFCATRHGRGRSIAGLTFVNGIEWGRQSTSHEYPNTYVGASRLVPGVTSPREQWCRITHLTVAQSRECANARHGPRFASQSRIRRRSELFYGRAGGVSGGRMNGWATLDSVPRVRTARRGQSPIPYYVFLSACNHSFEPLRGIATNPWLLSEVARR